VQVSTALTTVEVHEVPHAPQLPTVDRTSVHAEPQHSLPVPEQASPAPVVPRVEPQVHWPAPQVSLGPQTFEQAPQLPVLVITLTQALLQQLGVVPVHAAPAPTPARGPVPQPQRPPAHASPAPQRTPQPPQLLTSFSRLTQALPQQSGVVPVQASPLPAAGPVPHWQSPPALQISLAPQTLPQAPQLVVVVIERSQPSCRLGLQSAQPASQLE